MRIALFQPDIAGNVGTIIRLCACFGVPLEIIQPCGFPLSERSLRRAAMDYGAGAEIAVHEDFDAFHAATHARGERIVLMTSRGSARLPEGAFTPADVILMGSESAGVPDHVHESAALRLRIPMQPGMRSLNIAVAAGIALGEALRQTGRYPA